MTKPEVSVLLPVYNAGTYLREAVESILHQTYRKFELIIVDDGSTDESVAYLSGLRDPRTRIERSEKNHGIIATLNRGIGLCRAPLIARMDSDDIAESERLAEQKRVMDSENKLAVLGSDFVPFGNEKQGSWIRFFEPEEIAIALLFENPICHPTVMLRRSELPEPVYPKDYPHAEDYALWVKCGAKAKLRNLPKKLLRYRAHVGQVSRLHSETQNESIRRLVLRQMAKLGLEPNPAELYVHQSMAHGFLPSPLAERLMSRWSEKLLRANQKHGVYPDDLFRKMLKERRNRTKQETSIRLATMPLYLRMWWRMHSWRRSEGV
jgi:glycosyltransferase involved in cell wall biosynthesis